MSKKRWILWLLVALTVAFIFGESLLDQDLSEKQSTVIKTQVVEPVHKAFTGENSISYDIRDVAHTVEFAILGIEIVLLVRSKNHIHQWLETISYCGFAALTDESIQHFSGRAPELIDIWHDILGALIGSLIGLIIILLLERIKRKTEVE